MHKIGTNHYFKTVNTGAPKKGLFVGTCVPLMEANAKGHFIASLDLAQAFDWLTLRRAIATILKFGFPSKLARN